MRAWRRNTSSTPGDPARAAIPSKLTTTITGGLRTVTIITNQPGGWETPLTLAAGTVEMLRLGTWIAGLTVSHPTSDSIRVSFPLPSVPAPTRLRYNGGPPQQFTMGHVTYLAAFDLPVPF